MVNTKHPGLTGLGGCLKWVRVGCHPPGDPRVAPDMILQCYRRGGKRRFDYRLQVSVLHTLSAQGRMLKRVVTERRLADRCCYF